MAHSNTLHGGTRGPESTGHSLQKWLKNPRMICASQSRPNPGKPRSRSPKNRSVIGTKRKIQNRPNPRISATRKPPNLWFFFLHTRKPRVNQIKVVRRGSKCTWLEICLRKKRLQNKKPRKTLEHLLQNIRRFSFIYSFKWKFNRFILKTGISKLVDTLFHMRLTKRNLNSKWKIGPTAPLKVLLQPWYTCLETKNKILALLKSTRASLDQDW